MPTEVLVMCSRCGRPQQAGAGRCAACGADLPEAPLPSRSGASAAPFLSAELAGGRVLVGEGNRLSYRPGGAATPFLFELPGLRRLSLVHRPRYEALALTAVALGVVPWVPAMVRGLLVLVALVGVGLAFSGRRYTLVLESSGQERTRWDLGSVQRGSPMEQRVRAVWSTLSDVARARGVQVSGPAP